MLRAFLFSLLLLIGATASAGPFMRAGDIALRHDVQLLADAGVIRGTVSTWPMAWGPVLRDLEDADLQDASRDVLDAIARLRVRARWETAIGELQFHAHASVSENPQRIRGYDETPRGRGEIGGGLSLLGDMFSLELNTQVQYSQQDDQRFRFDQSRLGVALGNWSISASTMDRWWGPGWDGSLILSNNARPIPSLVVDRIFTDPFKSSWLSWIGPWDLTVLMGQLENDRVVPDTRFFGMRVAFRPLRSLEIGVSRTAQWCGEGRPCDADSFARLLVGRDNLGEDGVGVENEPGNQLAGFDFRWSPKLGGVNAALYGQFIGEDEAGGFPSRYMGQVGIDWSGRLADRWSTRAWVEYARTDCDFFGTSDFFDNRPGFNCVYNNGIYETGYRFRGQSIGHGLDNDAEVVSVGAVLVDAEDTQWRANLRVGELNRGGAPDASNTLTSTPRDLFSIDVAHSRAMKFGTLEIGVGYETRDAEIDAESDDDMRFFVQWRSDF